MKFENWLKPTPLGLFCEPGGFYIDPARPVDRAVITHAHADHARPGHAAVLATVETAGIMRVRLGEDCAGAFQTVSYGEHTKIGGVTVTLYPAGHVLGSAQVSLSYSGSCAVVSGDYKRRHDPTCTPFECVPCDLFVTEATFGLPVFRHEPDEREIGRLLRAVEDNPHRSILLGAYGLGKCQRLIRLLRVAGYDRPIWLHGAMQNVCRYYQATGIDLGDLSLVGETEARLAGEIVIAPPGALSDRWSRRLAEPLTVFASGWMRVRARARQRGAELPLILSDHADWPELLHTIRDTGAGEVWVTHGREDALVHQLGLMGLRGRALALVGREEEGE
jgi:putative mRNA 3-end processing factor